MRPIGYVGKSRLEAAQQHLPAAVSAWRQQWCLCVEDGANVFDLTLTAIDAYEIGVSALHVQQACAANGSIWLAAETRTCWQPLLFGQKSQHVPADDMATHLCLQAQLALANALLSALDQDEVPTLLATASTVSVMRHPGVCMSIIGPETHILIFLDASLLDAWLPLPAAEKPLWTRQQAIGGVRIPLRFMLPLSTLSAASLVELSPGDIISLTTPLTQHFHLETTRGGLIGKGIPVTASTRLAVQLMDC